MNFLTFAILKFQLINVLKKLFVFIKKKMYDNLYLNKIKFGSGSQGSRSGSEEMQKDGYVDRTFRAERIITRPERGRRNWRELQREL